MLRHASQASYHDLLCSRDILLHPLKRISQADPRPCPSVYAFTNSGIADSNEVYYYGEIVRMHPEIKNVCSQLLPDGVQRENTGVGGGEASEGGAKAAAADAERRNATKRTAREANGHLENNEKKAKKQETEMKKAAAITFNTVTEGLGLGGGGLGALFNSGAAPAPALNDAPASWYDTKEGVESRAAKLEFSNKLLDALENAEKRLEEAKEKGSSPRLIDALERKVAKIGKALEKDADEDI